MITHHIRLVSAVVLPLVATGCVTTDYSAKDAGFMNASAKGSEATGKQTVWVQNRQQAQAVQGRVKALLAKKTIDVETAVQVALLNNKGLQASYADLGDSAADAWQTQLSVLPTFSVGLTGIATPGLEAYRVLEGAVAANILALATYDKNIKLADTRFRQAQLNAAIATISRRRNAASLDQRRGGMGKRRLPQPGQGRRRRCLRTRQEDRRSRINAEGRPGS